MQKTAGSFDTRMDSLRESMRGLVGFSSERADALKERLREATDTFMEKGDTAVRRIVELVKQHPVASLGVAFGVGYLVVRIARR